MPGNQRGDPRSFQSLQEDAIRRAREMQSRAHFSPYGPPAPAAAGQPPRNPPSPSGGRAPGPDAVPERDFPPDSPPDSAERDPPPETGAGDLLDSLLKDNERTLIWVLLLILIEEKADTALIFALLYLIS